MGIRFGRHAFAMLALLGAPAVGQEPERFDLGRKDRWEVGDTTTTEGSSTEKYASRSTFRRGVVDESPEVRTTTTWNAVQRCLAVDEAGQVTRSLVHLVTWTQQRAGETDTCLAGTTIEVSGRGKARSWTRRAGPEEIPSRARSWLNGEYGPAPRFEDAVDMPATLPARPVAVGESWTPDLAQLLREMDFRSRVDMAKATSKGTLMKVEVVSGTRVAHVALEIALPLESPGILLPREAQKWTRGGTAELAFTTRLPLEGRLAPPSRTFTFALEGDYVLTSRPPEPGREPAFDRPCWTSESIADERTVTLGGEIPPLPEPAPPPPPK